MGLARFRLVICVPLVVVAAAPRPEGYPDLPEEMGAQEMQ